MAPSRQTSSARRGDAGTDQFAAEREAMVRHQIELRGVRDARVLAAMRSTPRHLFVPAAERAEAYADHPLAIGAGQTISQPYIVARMTELAELRESDRVLEIGTGSGYQTCILARLTQTVYTIEIHETLQAQARERLTALGISNVVYRAGDGTEGWPEAAPFDAIVVTAAPAATPAALRQQLADGGRLVIPVGEEPDQDLRLARRRGDEFIERSIFPVRFVPMTGKAGRLDRGA